MSTIVLPNEQHAIVVHFLATDDYNVEGNLPLCCTGMLMPPYSPKCCRK